MGEAGGPDLGGGGEAGGGCGVEGGVRGDDDVTGYCQGCLGRAGKPAYCFYHFQGLRQAGYTTDPDGCQGAQRFNIGFGVFFFIGQDDVWLQGCYRVYFYCFGAAYTLFFPKPGLWMHTKTL